MIEISQAVCPVYRKCGGCQLQNMSYEKQLARKQRICEELLSEFGRVNKIIGMENPYHYRNKVHAAFGLDANHRIISGIYQPNSHAIVPSENCMIEDESANAIINDIRRMLPEFKIQVYDERNESGWLRHVLVRRGFSSGEVMVVLVSVSPIFKLQKPFIQKLLEQHPEIITVVLNINNRFGPVVLGVKEKVLYGNGYIQDELCGKLFRISPRSFYQVNPVQTEKLYSIAIDFAELNNTETVLDAYCGIGTIGLSACGRAKQVIGVEINRDAVRDAIINAKLNMARNCWFSVGDAGLYLEQMVREKHGPDMVFMDPPRGGSDERFLGSLIKCAPKRVVYISCCPETLSRDLRILIKGGYAVRQIQPVDMFPFTNHVEVACLLVRRNGLHFDIDVDVEEMLQENADKQRTRKSRNTYWNRRD